MPTTDSRIRALDCLRSHAERSGYVAYHMPRYEALLARLSEHHAGGRILDIGPSPMTEAIRTMTGGPVDTMGLQADARNDGGQHWQFDLNRCQQESAWRRDLPSYDTVVMAEVIEHVHTAPSLVLRFLGSILETGGKLIIQTPNACALHKRLFMLLGRNPFEEFREDISSPGHYREYTRTEIRRFADRAGFEVLDVRYGSYFDYRYRRHGSGSAPTAAPSGAWLNTVYKLVPGGMRPGITCVARKKSGGAAAHGG